MYCCSVNNLGWNFIIGAKMLMKLLTACTGKTLVFLVNDAVMA